MIPSAAQLARKMHAAGASGVEAAAACDTLGKAAAKAVASVARVPTTPLATVKVENISVGREQAQKVRPPPGVLRCASLNTQPLGREQN